jgi:hypothetical protein
VAEGGGSQGRRGQGRRGRGRREPGAKGPRMAGAGGEGAQGGGARAERPARAGFRGVRARSSARRHRWRLWCCHCDTVGANGVAAGADRGARRRGSFGAGGRRRRDCYVGRLGRRGRCLVSGGLIRSGGITLRHRSVGWSGRGQGDSGLVAASSWDEARSATAFSAVTQGSERQGTAGPARAMRQSQGVDPLSAQSSRGAAGVTEP